MQYLQGFPSAVVYPITTLYSGKVMSFSQIFFSAVNIPDLLHPLPAAHMFLCSPVFFLWYMFPWHVVLFSSGPPASSPSPPGNSPLASCVVLVQFFLHGLEKAKQRCSVRQPLMKKERMDLTAP